MAALDAGCAHTSRPHWYTYALVKGHASHENLFTPLSSFLLVLSLSLSFFLFTSLLSLIHSFLQLITINYDPHLRIIQTLCLHLYCSTLLRKTLTVNHYLRIEYFQQGAACSGDKRQEERKRLEETAAEKEWLAELHAAGIKRERRRRGRGGRKLGSVRRQ